MVSKWIRFKEKALEMRRAGLSIRHIELELGIPRSTLSGWFKDVKLSKEQKNILHKKWLKGLASSREKARDWHNSQKAGRLLTANNEAEKIIEKIDLVK